MPPPLLRPARQGLEFALRPSALVRRVTLLLPCLPFFLALELALRGHWLAAPLMLLGALLLFAACWRSPWQPHRVGRRLVIVADGSIFLLTVEGRVVPVALHPGSLRLGPCLLLLLRGNGHVFRLFLGPDNVEPITLAALKRRLGGPSAGRGTALHS